MKIIIATTKSWNIANAKKLQGQRTQDSVFIITDKSELTTAKIEEIQPKYIFFPHWSYIISKEIYENWDCIVFHMTDLPYGRGGSPLQNLIVRGHTMTKISALKVTGELDAGPVYFKEMLSLEGNANSIFKRASDIIFNTMIPRLLECELTPHAQEGEVTLFKRRKPADSAIPAGLTLSQIYDYIRMLDGEGYPRAFLSLDHCIINFFDAELTDGKIVAKVEIQEKINE